MNQEIYNELKNRIFEKLGRNNIIVTSRVNVIIDRILMDSVNRMEKEKRITKEDIEIAKGSFDKLIEYTLSNVIPLRENQDIIIYEALSLSLNKLCPLWPIC